MSASRNAVYAVILVIAELLGGCTGHQRLYAGPALPPNEVAIVKGSIGLLPGMTSLSIMSVDGKQLNPYAEQVEVLPGAHIFGVQSHLHLGGGLFATGEIAIDALPGKLYQLESRSDQNTVTFSIVEVNDKK